MNDPVAQALAAIEDARKNKARRTSEVVIRRYAGTELCVGWIPWYKANTVADAVLVKGMGSERWAPCNTRSSFEVRGRIRVYVCPHHLGWIFEVLLIADVDDMEAHFGCHSSLSTRNECKYRESRQWGAHYAEQRSCWHCDDRKTRVDRAQATKDRQRIRRAALRQRP